MDVWWREEYWQKQRKHWRTWATFSQLLEVVSTEARAKILWIYSNIWGPTNSLKEKVKIQRKWP
jgi:hypothetical protein